MINFKHGDTCPVCEVGVLQEREGSFSFKYNDKKFLVQNVTEFYCKLCSETFLNRGDEREVERMAIEFRRKEDGLLTPSDIKKIRDNLKCTQVEFAKLLGIGEKTFARYENGSVTQSKSMDMLLKLIQDDPDRSFAVICASEPVKTERKSLFEWGGVSKTKTYSDPYKFTQKNVLHDFAKVG